MGLEPKLAGRRGRIDAGSRPPTGFIAAAVDLTMMATAEWHSELIADLATEGAALGKAQMMRIGRHAATDQTRLLGNEPDVLAIANTPRLGKRQNRLIDPWPPHCRSFALTVSHGRLSAM